MTSPTQQPEPALSLLPERPLFSATERSSVSSLFPADELPSVLLPPPALPKRQPRIISLFVPTGKILSFSPSDLVESAGITAVEEESDELDCSEDFGTGLTAEVRCVNSILPANLSM